MAQINLLPWREELRQERKKQFGYAMIGVAMTNSADNARLMKRSILKLRPDYDLDAWVEGLLKRSDPVFANNVSITLQRHSLI